MGCPCKAKKKPQQGKPVDTPPKKEEEKK